MVRVAVVHRHRAHAKHHGWPKWCKAHWFCRSQHKWTKTHQGRLRHWAKECRKREKCQDKYPWVKVKAAPVVSVPSGSVPITASSGPIAAAEAAYNVGMRDENSLITAVSICIHESGCSLIQNYQGAPAYGSWQVYTPYHPQYSPSLLLSSWPYNAQAMYQISNGGISWGPWYPDALYLPEAVAPVQYVLRLAGR
jgi:hypothetical protein